nr:MAG TPA: hypothetical protein [Caudoviricetes sp.]
MKKSQEKNSQKVLTKFLNRGIVTLYTKSVLIKI